MASRTPRPRRLLVSTLLAAVLVGEITGLALARSVVPPAASAPTGAAVQAPPAARDLDRSLPPVVVRAGIADASRDPISSGAGSSRLRWAPTARPAVPQPASVVRVVKVNKASPTTRSSGSSGSKLTSSASYQGRNRVWIPFLGINRSVESFPCSRSRPPDNYVYRWGCAGRNNVYLLGHAYSVFKPLHDAYVRGRLKKGMKVMYADGSGRVGRYSVIWWRVVRPTTDASWAWAPLNRPGMTLQTCVGANSEFRLMVRLTKVG